MRSLSRFNLFPGVNTLICCGGGGRSCFSVYGLCCCFFFVFCDSSCKLFVQRFLESFLGCVQGSVFGVPGYLSCLGSVSEK